MNCKCRKVKKRKKKRVQVRVKYQNTAAIVEKNSVMVLPNVTTLEQKVNETVIGQEDVIKSVCTKIYEGMVFPQLKDNILIVGKSGTGKTEIIRQISENLKVPCTIEDSTSYTEEGFIGASVTEMIINLIREAKGDLELASRGIIFVDEIDKKAKSSEELYGEVNKSGVLKSLLKLIEGTQVYVPNPDFNQDMKMENISLKKELFRFRQLAS